MKHLILFAISMAFLGAAPANAQRIEVSPSEARPSRIGPAETFTGTVIVDPLFDPRESTRASGMLVTFAPGARSAWHSHPAGQTLVVTSGAGWVQEWGGERRPITPGDVVWTPPGVKHWHGATATNGMSHLAILEAVEGEVVTWMEHVTDEQYQSNTTDGKKTP